MSGYDDVKAFHLKFGVPTDADALGPFVLDEDTARYRAQFLQEELDEFKLANESNDLEGALDALIDLVYVAYGSALLMGVSPACWQEAWNEVQRANVSKERATSAADPRSKRSHSLDVVKPEGWRAPNHAPIIERHTRQPATPPPPVDRSNVVLADGSPIPPDGSHRKIVESGARAGQQQGYVVLSEEERKKGFVRPFRDAYRHLKCGKITVMGRSLGETYARDPFFYSGTFCSHCQAHYPVGEDGEFTWYEMDGSEGPKVGT